MNAETNRKAETTGNRSPRAGCEGRRQLRTTLRVSRRAISREFDADSSGDRHLTRLVLDEAEAIAWQTGFPQLVFPSLAEEKLRAVATWSRRQQTLKRRPPKIEGFSA